MNAPTAINTAQIRSARFRAERQDGWRALEALVSRVERRGARSLSFDEAQQLASLYRQAMASLSLAREISLDRALLVYLDALCARAYLAVYAPQENLRGLITRTLVVGIPSAARRCFPVIALGFLILILGTLMGWLLFQQDPLWYNTVMPEGMASGRGLESSRADLERVIYNDRGHGLGDLTAFSSMLFSHNTRIAIFVFSLGILICIPSVGLTLYNGMALGAFVALHEERGLLYDIVAWLSVHGVTELSAICIACAGGMHLGLAVLFPGDLTRRDALRARSRDAVKLALLAAMMLIIAALLEGFARQLVQDPDIRLAIGLATGAFWILYLARSGRQA